MPESERKALGDDGGGLSEAARRRSSTTPGSASSSPTTRGRPCGRSGARCWRSTAKKICKFPPKENLAEIDKALKAGGNRNVKTVELPGLNHLFQPCKTGAPS